MVFKPSDQPQLAPRDIDVEAAVKSALANRTDVQQLKKQMDSTDISLKYAQNQKLPGVDLQARYGVTGVGGTLNRYDPTGISPDVIGTSVRGFGDVVRDVFGNNFRTWSVALNVSYPIGTSQADAAFAQGKLQRRQEDNQLTNLEMTVTTAVREAARNVNTDLKRVEATRKAREFAQQRLDAENKRFTVGLSTTFELFQAQRDLARAQQNELRATISYNQSLVDFEAVQIAPIR
jgi:outer membrane protein TolC